MTTYTDVFGNSTVPPAGYGYQAIALTADTTFVWPYNTTGSSSAISKIMDVTPSAAYAMTLPAANQVSTGEDFLIRNVGSFTITVKDAAGNVLGTVAAGIAQYFYVTLNTTAAGAWGQVTYGAGSSSVSAGQLVGYGIKAITTTLNQSHPTYSSASNISVDATYRAKMVIATGGAVTISLAAAATVGDDFFFIFRNAGTGTATLDPNGAETFDGQGTFDVQPGESLLAFCSGAAWYSAGYGRSTLYQFTQLVKDVSVGSPFTLSATEASNKLLTFTGTPVAGVTVIVPNVVAVYYIQNALSTAQSVTVKTAAGTGVSVPQTQRIVALCDATNVVSAQSVQSNTSVSLIDGNAAAPSLNFSSQTNTGLFKYSTHGVGVAANGLEIAHFDTADVSFAAGKLVLTIPASATTLALASGSTFTTVGAFGLTITATNTTNSTLPAGTHTLAGLDVAQTWTAVQTITNSDLRLLGSSTGYTTFTSDNAGASNYTLHFPAINDTLATLGGTEELTNKTLTSAVAKGTWTASGTWKIPAVTFNGAVDGGTQNITNLGTLGCGAITTSGKFLAQLGTWPSSDIGTGANRNAFAGTDPIVLFLNEGTSSAQRLAVVGILGGTTEGSTHAAGYYLEGGTYDGANNSYLQFRQARSGAIALKFDSNVAATFGGAVSLGTNSLTAGAGNFSGTIGVTGTATVGKAVLTGTGTTTGYQYISLTNTGNSFAFAIEGTPGAQLLAGSSAYDAVLSSTTQLRVGINNSIVGTFSSTGLAVTGTLSATGFTLDASGNLGLGVTPSAWSSKAFEIGYVGNAVMATASNDIQLVAGAKIVAGQWKYAISSAPVSNFYLDSGGFGFRTAASGTANNNITWTDAISINSTGSLTVSGTGPHAIGGATSTEMGLRITGAFITGNTNASGVDIRQTLTNASGGDIYGLAVVPGTMTGVGVTPGTDFCTALFYAPAIAGTAPTNATTVKINAAPSSGTNKRALWVAAGLSQFDGSVTANYINTADGTTASTASATPVTIYTIGGTAGGLYLVTAWVSDNNASNYSAHAFVTSSGGTTPKITATNGANVTLTLSGLAIQATQTSGSSQTINYSVLRLA